MEVNVMKFLISDISRNADERNNEVRERHLDNFIEKDDEVFAKIQHDWQYKEIKLANFTVRVLGLCEVDGMDSVESYVIYAVSCPHQEPKDCKILKKDFIQNLLNDVCTSWPGLRIYSNVPNSTKLFREYLSESYETAEGSMPTARIYLEAGWTADGRYLSGSDWNCKSKCKIPDASGITATQISRTAQNIHLLSGDPRISVAIFLQFHADTLAHLFALAGFPIQHLMAYVGLTGSRKTAVATVMHGKMFNVNTVVNFTATEAAVDLVMHSICRDGTIVYDNFSNAKNRKMRDKINHFLLQFGDSIAKQKTANRGTELVKNEIRGCAVLTAESLMDNLQLSSRLRLLVVPFTETSIDNEVLTAFQEDRLQSERTGCPAMLDLYKASFIRFVEHHFTELIQFISEFLPPPLQLRFPRQARIYKILATVAAIAVRFLEECGTLSADDGARLLDESLIPALQDLLHYNESLHVTEDPIELFLQAIASGVVLNLIDIATDKDEFFKRAKTAIGFWDDQILKLDPRRTYRYVSGVYAAQRFTATEADIWAALRDKKISEGYFDKKKGMASLFKKIQVNGVTTEMLCLRWDKVEEILNESRLDEEDIEE